MIKILIDNKIIKSHFIFYKVGQKPFFILPTITIGNGYNSGKKYIKIDLFFFTFEVRTILYIRSKQNNAKSTPDPHTDF